MQMKLLGILIVVFFMLPTVLLAQETNEKQDKKMIEILLEDLFDGMREGDSAKVARLFRNDDSMRTSYVDQHGERVLKQGSLDQFLQAIGTPHDKVWNERLYNLKIEVDQNIAQAWADYTFYLGEEFSHCGVDAFHLVKEEGHGWRIIHLMDTRRKNDCISEP
jgi:hypothetical protein